MSRMSAGIYIDDAGTPGAVSPSAFLHTNRKSWAAVVVPEETNPKLTTALNIFLEGIATDHNAKELHFTDIYGGRGAFADLTIDKRFELIDLMATIFEEYQLPILFQTSSPEFLSESRPKLGAVTKLSSLDLNKHDDFALLFLLFQVRQFISENKQHFREPLPVFIDEGRAKAGAVLKLPPLWADTFRNGRIEFRKSHECPHLQLADFAAFAIGRSQWLLGKGNLKPHDIRFLNIVSAKRLCIINLPSVSISPGQHTTVDFDELLKRDRRAKGLPDDPPKLD